MRLATIIFTFLASLALLLLALEGGESAPATDRVEPMFSVFDAAGVGLGIWVVSALLVLRYAKAAAVLYILAGTIMLAFGFLDFGVWNGIFVFGIISFAFAAMAWASWLVQVLWSHHPPVPTVSRMTTEESLVHG